MLRIIIVSSLPILSIMAWPNLSGADVIVRAPFVNVKVGNKVDPNGRVVAVRIPCVINLEIQTSQRTRTARPVRVVEKRSGINGEGELPPPEKIGGSDQVPTIKEFAKTFRPIPGSYEIALIHPVKKKPVAVRFSLPDGTPKKVRARARELYFDYGKHWVRIRFLGNGQVRVKSK